eukprot:Lankesteria_metandrocarpae@DN3533_c0_g1_i1.p1
MCKKPSPCKDHDCPFAHSVDDLIPSAELMTFKTSLCLFWHEGKCFYGSKCRFAHGAAELRTRRKEVPRSPPQGNIYDKSATNVNVSNLKPHIGGCDTLPVKSVKDFPPNPGIIQAPHLIQSHGVYTMPLTIQQKTPATADGGNDCLAHVPRHSRDPCNCCESIPRGCTNQNADFRQAGVDNTPFLSPVVARTGLSKVCNGPLPYYDQTGYVHVVPNVSHRVIPNVSHQMDNPDRYVGSGGSAAQCCCSWPRTSYQNDSCSTFYGGQTCELDTSVYRPCRRVGSTAAGTIPQSFHSEAVPARFRCMSPECCTNRCSPRNLSQRLHCCRKTPTRPVATRPIATCLSCLEEGNIKKWPFLTENECFSCVERVSENVHLHTSSAGSCCDLSPPDFPRRRDCKKRLMCKPSWKKLGDHFEHLDSSQLTCTDVFTSPASPQSSVYAMEQTPSTTCSSDLPPFMVSDGSLFSYSSKSHHASEYSPWVGEYGSPEGVPMTSPASQLVLTENEKIDDFFQQFEGRDLPIMLGGDFSQNIALTSLDSDTDRSVSLKNHPPMLNHPSDQTRNGEKSYFSSFGLFDSDRMKEMLLSAGLSSSDINCAGPSLRAMSEAVSLVAPESCSPCADRSEQSNHATWGLNPVSKVNLWQPSVSSECSRS